MKTGNKIKVIGAGLAGCEAAFQLAERGTKVALFDIKPKKFTPAHSNKNLAELVCSNSLKSNELSTAGGLLKAELRALDSLCIKAADASAVPAGGALAVDRIAFSEYITRAVLNHKNIEFISDEISSFEADAPVMVAAGPLATAPLLEFLSCQFGQSLNFYDAAAPIICTKSIDFNHVFFQNRYNKGTGSVKHIEPIEPTGDYINCPLNKTEYEEFINELINAGTAVKRDFEKGDVFEGCMPIEVMARRGIDTLRHGPLKPVGLTDKNGCRPYAAVQLRREDELGQMYNLVGFQTNLTFKEQRRVFSIIPALKNAEFLRFGVMHINSFVNAPAVLNAGFNTKKLNNVFIIGQLSGVEGYCESIMSGLIGALNFYSLSHFNAQFIPPAQTMSGALTYFIANANNNFQPMNANFGLLPPLDQKIRDKQERKLLLSKRALKALEEYKKF